MRVKVHPHKNLVNSGVEACVSVTPIKRHGRAYYMGTVMLRDVSFTIHESGVKRAQAEQVRNVHAWAVGEIVHEAVEQNKPSKKVLDNMVQVTYHYNIGRFITVGDKPVDVTEKSFKAALFVGRDFYVSKDGI